MQSMVCTVMVTYCGIFYRVNIFCNFHDYYHCLGKHQYHTIIRAAFVCLCVCSLSPPRSFDGSSPNLVSVCRWTSHLPLRGSFSKRSTGRRVNRSLSLSTILYMRQPHATQLQKAPFALLLLHLIRLKGTFCCTASRRLVAVCRWTSELLAQRVICPSCKKLH